MAGSAKGHEIVSCMSAALRQGDFVMNFFCGYQSAFFPADLAQRMLLYITVTNPLPCTAITAADSGITIIFFIAFCFRPCMILTEPTMRQPGTAGVRTWSLGFTWHIYPPSVRFPGVCSGGCTRSVPDRKPCGNPLQHLQGMKKALTELLPCRLCSMLFC